jgi:DNA modification methylase
MAHTPSTWEISAITIGQRFRGDLGNLDDLVDSIRDIGLLHPLVITPTGALIAGERRLEACRRLGWCRVPVRVVDIKHPLRGQYDENAVRKGFLPSEAVAIRDALLEYERELARKRQGARTDRLPEKFAGSPFGNVRDRLASYTNLSGYTLEKAVKIVEAAKCDPERYGKLVEEMDRTGRIDPTYRRLTIMQEAEWLAQEDTEGLGVRVICGDALSVLRDIPSESVHCCVTSPPYWALRDYGVPGQIGLEPTFTEYITKLCDIFDEVKRVLKKEGTCWVNMGDTYSTVSGRQGKGDLYGKQPKFSKSADEAMPTKIKTALPNKSLCQIPSRFAIEMCNRGWILRNEIIWHKPNCMPQSVKDRFTVDFEKLFFFVKSQEYYFETQYEPALMNRWGGSAFKPKDGYQYKSEAAIKVRERDIMPEKRCMRSVWAIPTKPYTEAHFAAYPPELVHLPIRAGCPPGGVVLDPFVGSGTTAAVARQLERRFIGVELNADSIHLTYE